MSCSLQNLTPRTSTPSSPFPEPVFQHSEQPCEDQRPQQRGALTETPPLAGYEPNHIVEDQDYRHFTGDGQFTELEDLRVRTLPFHQTIIASTYDSAESIATWSQTLMTNNFVLCWLHHCTYRSEEQVQNDDKFIILNEKP